MQCRRQIARRHGRRCPLLSYFCSYFLLTPTPAAAGRCNFIHLSTRRSFALADALMMLTDDGWKAGTVSRRRRFL